MKVEMWHFVNVTQRSGSVMMGRSSGPTPSQGLSQITSQKLSLGSSGGWGVEYYLNCVNIISGIIQARDYHISETLLYKYRKCGDVTETDEQAKRGVEAGIVGQSLPGNISHLLLRNKLCWCDSDSDACVKVIQKRSWQSGQWGQNPYFSHNSCCDSHVKVTQRCVTRSVCHIFGVSSHVCDAVLWSDLPCDYPVYQIDIPYFRDNSGYDTHVKVTDRGDAEMTGSSGPTYPGIIPYHTDPPSPSCPPRLIGANTAVTIFTNDHHSQVWNIAQKAPLAPMDHQVPR